jgi:hypothetical protein
MARNHRSFVPGDPWAGRHKGIPNKATREIRELAQRLLSDPAYQAHLKKRLRAGTAGQLEIVLYYYAYGKPAEKVQVAGEADRPAIHLEWQDSARERIAARLEEMATRLEANTPPDGDGHGV